MLRNPAGRQTYIPDYIFLTMRQPGSMRSVMHARRDCITTAAAARRYSTTRADPSGGKVAEVHDDGGSTGG
jgi:hypothetical protein